MQDDNRDGRIDERDAAPARGQPVAGGQPNDPTTYRGGTASGSSEGALAAGGTGIRRDESDDTQRFTADQPLHGGPAGSEHPPVGAPSPGYGDPAYRDPAYRDPAYREPAYRDDTYRDTTPEHRADDEVTVVSGPRPRASLLATLSLIFGVAGALFVLTGTLAGYGIALGAIALLLSFAGLSATGRRHVAGKSDAILGMLLGLGAVAVGVLAITGQLSWPNTDADTVQRFREWLDAQFVDRF